MRLLFIAVMLLLSTMSIAQKPFENDFAFCAYFNSTGDELTDELMELYLQNYHSKDYRSAKKSGNEFEYKKYFDAEKKSYLSLIDGFSFEESYSYQSKCNLAEYDFDKESFAIQYDHNVSKGNIHPKNGYTDKDYLGKVADMTPYSVLKLEPAKAEELMKKLEVNGIVNRGFDITITFKLNGNTDKKEFKMYSAFTFARYALIDIIKIDFYQNGQLVFSL